MTRSFQHFVACWWICSIYLLSKTEVDAAPDSDTKNNHSRVPINLQSLSLEEKKKFKDSFDIIFTDCDGVLYTPEGIINNSHETVKELIKEGKTIRYVTNSSRKTKAQTIERLRKSGFVDASEESVICPMGFIGDYVRDKLQPGKSVYVVGPELVCEELRRHNIPCFGPGKDEMSDQMTTDIAKAQIEFPENVGAVILGFDIHINYLKMLKAFRFLTNKDCLYMVLIPDETFASNPTTVFPGDGAISASITKATGREPFILGKPGAHLVEVLKTVAKDPQRALFVGDKLNIDMATGHKCSFRTLFVLSGFDNLDDVKKYAGSKDPEERMYVPDFYTNYFSDLVFK